MTDYTTDLCVIGAGSGGLSIAAAASQMGIKVILLERHLMGGDCLNYGCVPSKSLLASAKLAARFQHETPLGIESVEPTIDFIKVKQHVKEVIATIAPHDSVERFTELGVKVLLTNGKFIDRKTLQTAQGDKIFAKYFVVATGSRAFIPAIPGINDVNYFTNETIFDLQQKPKHLIILGAGPIGCEMAQAHRYLGCEVSVLSSNVLLPRDDQALTPILRKQFIDDGIKLYENIQIVNIANGDNQIDVTYNGNDTIKQISGSHLLIATGRTANIEELALTTAGIEYDSKGIHVDKRLRTTNKKIFAIGDVARGYQFTHIANYHAGIVIQNALFKIPAKVNYSAIPWVTYTSPELAHVGCDEKTAKQKDSKMQVLTCNFADIDRAQAERKTTGLIKVFIDRKARILGVTILGHNAGELLLPWSIAITKKLKLSAIASSIVAYPTFSEISKRVAGSYYAKKLFSKKVKMLVKVLGWFTKP